MFNKTTLVLAASAFLLTACGGGGGGSSGGSNTSLPSPGQACKANNLTFHASDIVNKPSGAPADPLNSLAKDAAVLVAGANLYRTYLGGGANQFGDMSASSVEQGTSDIGCGVYVNNGLEIGTTLAPAGTVNVVLYCVASYGKSGETVSRHYFKLTPNTPTSAAGVTTQTFNVKGVVDQASCAAGQTLVFGAQTATLSARWTGSGSTSSPVSDYTLVGKLPASFTPNAAAYFNQTGNTDVNVGGSVSIAGGYATESFGLVGSATVNMTSAVNPHTDITLPSGTGVAVTSGSITLSF